MRRETGHVFVANAIWTIGLPRLHDETCNSPLKTSRLSQKPFRFCWNGWIASPLCSCSTAQLQSIKIAVRKSGVAHGQSGPSATEQETRAATRKAKFDMRAAKKLAKPCNDASDRLLEAYWNRSLHERLREVASKGNADTMCRTPSLAIGSATEQTIY